MTSSTASNRVIISVDLASKFSAVHIAGLARQPMEYDSRDKTAIEFAGEVAEDAWDLRERFENDVWVMIEDVPYGISSQAMVKPVLRLQGIFIDELSSFGALDRTVFVNPSTWQRFYPGVARGKAEDRIEAARVAALNLGYEPPNLVQQYIDAHQGEKILKKHTNPLTKSMTDYIDAKLMNHWASQFATFEDLLAVSGVQPVYL